MNFPVLSLADVIDIKVLAQQETVVNQDHVGHRSTMMMIPSPTIDHVPMKSISSEYEKITMNFDLKKLKGRFYFSLSSLLQGLTSNDRFSDGPTCHSLLDPQYPLFSDICGVIPQARYALPNFFGHYEKWQIVQTLTTVLGPGAGPVASDPACTRALRLLVCPLLFPPCKTRRDLLSILPCQPFCHGSSTLNLSTFCIFPFDF